MLQTTTPQEILGFVCHDRVTGFQGVALGYVTYLSGCNQVLLVPSVTSEGKLGESHWFDVQRLTVIATETRLELDNFGTPGCDAPAPKR